MEFYILITMSAAILILLLILVVRSFKSGTGSAGNITEPIDRVRRDLIEETRASRQELNNSVRENIKSMSTMLTEANHQTATVQDKRLVDLNVQLTGRQETLQKTVVAMLGQIEERFKSFSLQSEQKLDNIRTTVENRLTSMQDDNNKKLELMRATVDEKLQKTLEDRLGKSFQIVSERLEQVYKGLGEMQTLAVGVGDLKKVLSNVKTRGILGEIQLGAILEQILAKEQYDQNVVTKKGSTMVVEYAVKLPGDGSGTIYLPIDSKFPADAYTQLIEAYETGSQTAVDAAAAQLDRRIKQNAKDIKDKYIDPPHTTDFAIMFLPFEGLYAEVVRRGLIETLQRDYKVNIAGPTTMAALLNSLQMGFKTLAIQKRSGEVWNILGAVKTEFDKFGDVLEATKQRLEQANTELDRLVGVRTRKIRQKLNSVTSLPEINANIVFAESEETSESDD